MPRRCTCDRFNRDGPLQEGDCVRCWMWHHNPHYRAHHGGPKPKSQQVMAFIGAVLNHARLRLPNVSDEIFEERMATCRGCEHYTAKGNCRLCGCGLKKKARWAEQACPAGKWLPAAIPL